MQILVNLSNSDVMPYLQCGFFDKSDRVKNRCNNGKVHNGRENFAEITQPPSLADLVVGHVCRYTPISTRLAKVKQYRRQTGGERRCKLHRR
jgi:hypothetical protein